MYRVRKDMNGYFYLEKRCRFLFRHYRDKVSEKTSRETSRTKLFNGQPQAEEYVKRIEESLKIYTTITIGK